MSESSVSESEHEAGRHHLRPSPAPRPQPAPPQAAPGSPSTNGTAPAEVGAGLVDLVRNANRVDAADAIGLARVAGTVVWRAVNTVTRRSLGAATEIARDVQAGEPVSEIIDNQVERVRSAAVHALGLDNAQAIGDAAPTSIIPLQESVAGRSGAPAKPSARRPMSEADLRKIGDQLLRRSAYARNQPYDVHPAFAQMLAALTPDEGRILRFLNLAGPQPSIDVRTKTPFGIGSERIAGGLNMIAEMAGCSYPNHDNFYLANLNRLGLVRFSQEPVVDFRRYSLIEVQPMVEDAVASVKKAVTVYRSIYLSGFGKQFCDACFDMNGYDAGGWGEDDRGDKIIGKGPPKPKAKTH